LCKFIENINNKGSIEIKILKFPVTGFGPFNLMDLEISIIILGIWFPTLRVVVTFEVPFV